MKGMTFETFRVDDGNSEAYDLCRRFAMLEHEPGRLAVLLGPAGAGKSHLLWSIVKHVRASAIRAGLAFVMAREFPQRVRELALDPSPIQDGKTAILLVDELELFREDAYTLEGVIKVFLANGHGVLLASAVHPDRLSAFTEPFRALLCKSEIVEIRAPEALLSQDETELAEIDALRAERDALELKLAEKATLGAELSDARGRLEAALAEMAELKSAANDQSALDALRAKHAEELRQADTQRATLNETLEALRAERDALEQRLAERAAAVAAAEEIPALRQRSSAVESERDALAEVVRATQARLAETEQRATTAEALRDEGAAELDLLREQLQNMTGARDALAAQLADTSDRIASLEAYRAEATHLREQTAALESALEQERADAGAASEILESHAASILATLEEERAADERTINALRDEVAALLVVARNHGPVTLAEHEELKEELADARSLAAAFRVQAEQQQRALEDEVSALRQEIAELESQIETARGEIGHLNIAHETAKARTRSVSFELEKERKQISLLTAEMEALRGEAAAQVAQANIQAGEMESRLANLTQALDAALNGGRVAAAEVAALREAMDAASALLASAAAGLEVFQHLGMPEESDRGEAKHNVIQGHLFDAAPYMRQLAMLPGPGDAPSIPPPDANGRELHDLVDEVLSTPPPVDQDA